MTKIYNIEAFTPSFEKLPGRFTSADIEKYEAAAKRARLEIEYFEDSVGDVEFRTPKNVDHSEFHAELGL